MGDLPDSEYLFDLFLFVWRGRYDEQPVQHIYGDAVRTRVVGTSDPE